MCTYVRMHVHTQVARIDPGLFVSCNAHIIQVTIYFEPQIR